MMDPPGEAKPASPDNKPVPHLDKKTDDDVNSPVQVNLLFVQSRDGIINGMHPCTKDESVLFAALQCQVQFGNHDEAKHKEGFLNLGEFLPKEYLKFNGIEMEIFREHRKLYDTTEINAKCQYITLCRSLKTYGATFFLVKEKMKGRKMLVPRLLGITRESILRVDENTKEVLKTWPHTAFRRWGVSPNSFTLDFGNYHDSKSSYYSVQTMEGEAISQLIAMYTSTTLQETPIHPELPNEEEEPAIIEETVDPRRANIMRKLEEVEAITQQLETPLEVPTMNSDNVSMKWHQKTLDVSRQNVSAALAAILASAASVITQTSQEPDIINYTAVNSAITTISTNLSELAKAVRMLAALTPNETDSCSLLDAARALAGATSSLLNSAHPERLKNRQDLIAAAGDMGATGGSLLLLAESADVDMRTQEALVSMAKAVASATAPLVINARNIAAKCDDAALQTQVITAAKQTAQATQSLVACTKVLASTIDSHLCQGQLIEACELVSAAVEKIVLAAQKACGDDDALRDLGAAATAVTHALNSLIEQIKRGAQLDDNDQYDEAYTAILTATENLFSSMGNPQEMVKQAKLLAEATSSLVDAIKLQAESETDPEARRCLLDATKALADATSKMVEAAKSCDTTNPNNEHAQENLRLAAEHLKAVTQSAAVTAVKKN